MEQQISEQLGMGVFSLLAGISGWVLPYRWNILRLRRSFAKLASERVNKLIPKIMGSILIIVGLVVLIATAIVGKFE